MPFYIVAFFIDVPVQISITEADSRLNRLFAMGAYKVTVDGIEAQGESFFYKRARCPRSGENKRAVYSNRPYIIELIELLVQRSCCQLTHDFCIGHEVGAKAKALVSADFSCFIQSLLG